MKARKESHAKYQLKKHFLRKFKCLKTLSSAMLKSFENVVAVVSFGTWVAYCSKDLEEKVTLSALKELGLNKCLTSTFFTIDRSGFSRGPTIRNSLLESSEPASTFNMAVKRRGRPLNTNGLFAVLNFRKISIVSFGPEPGRFNTEPKAIFKDARFTCVMFGIWDNVKPSPCFT